MGQIDDSGWQPLRCPFGGAGDFLYVREAFKHVVSGALSETGAGATFGQLRYGIAYRADGATVWDQHTTRVTQIAGTPTGPLHFSTKPNPWRRAINMARRFPESSLRSLQCVSSDCGISQISMCSQEASWLREAPARLVRPQIAGRHIVKPISGIGIAWAERAYIPRPRILPSGSSIFVGDREVVLACDAAFNKGSYFR